MNPKTATIIGLRLLVIYLFFQIIPSIAFSLYSITKPEYLSLTTIGYQLSQVALYIIPMIILIKYSDTIANKITRSVPDESFHSNLTSTNLLAILIAASAVFVIISAIPVFTNQLYGFITFYQMELQFQPEKQRFNESIIGVLGVTLQIIVSSVVFVKAKKMAIYWEKL